MSQNLPQENPEFEQSDSEPVILTLPSDEVVGLSAKQLSQIIKIPPAHARWIIAEAQKMAQNGDIAGSDDITKLILAFSDLAVEDSEDELLTKNGASVNPHHIGLLTAFDIGRVFNIQTDFAAKILKAYGKPVNGEADFEAFYNFLKEYVQQYHGGKFPETARRPEKLSAAGAVSQTEQTEQNASTVPPAPVVTNNNPINTMMQAAEAVESDKRTEARPFTDERLTQILTSETGAAGAEKTPEEIEIDRKKKILAKVCEIFAERLEITTEDVSYILEDPENFAVIAGIDNPQEAERILNDTLNGKIDEALAYIERNRSADNEPEATTAPPQAQVSATEEVTLSEPVKQSAPHTEIEPEEPKKKPLSVKDPIPNVPPLTEAEITKMQEEKQESAKHAESDPQQEEFADQEEPETVKIPMPDSVAESLRLCMKMRGRVTSKSLTEIFKNFGSDISTSLAKFIIEEGGYGGEGAEKKRIVSEEELNRMIDDIGTDLRGFLRVYLQKVNEQVKNMLYGGS